MLTPKLIRNLFDYDPKTGVLTWRSRPLRPGFERVDKGWNTRFVGRPAGRPDAHGHLYVSVAYPAYSPRNYACHRVAWAHYYGAWPRRDIDHRNGRPDDNRIANLRMATAVENRRNSRRRADNTSGHIGVSWSRTSRKWYAYINIDGRMVALGLYAALEDAVQARRDAAVKHFGDFAPHGHD